MRRTIEPEILDELPPGDPGAIRSRRDLRRINFLMGNDRLLARLFRDHLPAPPRTIVELGSGDGLAMLALARRLTWPPLKILLIDRQPVVEPGTVRAFGQLGWEANVLAADIHQWAKNPQPSDLTLANLFLHHFSDEELRSLFLSLSKSTQVLAGCEPHRSWPGGIAVRFLWAIGCNEVTRHDAVASVRAGFCDRELSALWPAESGFQLHEKPGSYASHLFLALKQPGLAPRGYSP